MYDIVLPILTNDDKIKIIQKIRYKKNKQNLIYKLFITTKFPSNNKYKKIFDCLLTLQTYQINEIIPKMNLSNDVICKFINMCLYINKYDIAYNYVDKIINMSVPKIKFIFFKSTNNSFLLTYWSLLSDNKKTELLKNIDIFIRIIGLIDEDMIYNFNLNHAEILRIHATKINNINSIEVKHIFSNLKLDTKKSLCIWSSKIGHLRYVKLLVDESIPQNLISKCLYHATENKKNKIVEFLLKNIDNNIKLPVISKLVT